MPGRVVVTGGAGFIGSHLVDKLLNLSYQVTVIDDFSTGKESNLNIARTYSGQFDLVEMDITEARLGEVVSEIAPEHIFHLAAQADVRKSIEDPVHDARVNLLGSINLIQAAKMSGVKRIIYAASGGTLYGEPATELLPLSEEIPRCPLSFYGVSKAGVIDYLVAQAALGGPGFVALALANVYGPRQDPHGEAGVVSIFAGRLAREEKCAIYGSGEQTRDFVHVSDVVEAFIASMGSGNNEVINISSGVETSVNKLYSTMVNLMNYKLEPVYLEGRLGEISRSCLSNKKAKAVLGWSPEMDLESGLESVIDWVKDSI